MRSFQNKRRLWCFITHLFTLAHFTAFANPPVSYLSINQGLSNNSVRCIFQDHSGFMWFGTYDGLNRYDGYGFKTFRNNLKNANSLINNWINAISEDGYGNMWLGTRQGACIYRSVSGNFSPVYYASKRNTSNKVTSVIRDIDRDDKGNMFIGTADNGLLFCRNGDSVSFSVPLNNEASDSNQYDVSSIETSPDKKVWVFVRDRGLYTYDYRLQKLLIVNAAIKSANTLEAGGGVVWVGTNNGVNRYNIMSNSYDKIYNVENNKLSYNDVIGLTLDRHNKLWIATNGGGVNVLDTEQDTIEYLSAAHNNNSLSSNSVYAIVDDKDGRKWIGTLRGGINIIDPRKERFRTIEAEPATSNTLISNYIFSFYEEPSGKIWVGTDGGGLSIWDRTLNRFTNYKHDPNDPGSLSDNYITDIKGDHDKNIWIATYRGGINRYNKGTGTFERYQCADSTNSNIISSALAYVLFEDQQRTFWAGTLQGGLFRLNAQKKVFELFDKNLKDVLVLKEDRKKNLWAGNLFQLIRVDKQKRNHLFYNIGKPVRSILEDRAGNLWIGTEGGGLVLFDRTQSKIIARYTTDEGLCSNSILNILEDDDGSLWMSTFNGISRFNVKARTFKNYYQSDGLQSNQFNYNAALKLSTGELLFGGIKGFTLFKPQNITPENSTPKIVVTGIKISNTPIEQESGLIAKFSSNVIESIRVPYDKAVLAFEFAALEYSAPDKIQYAYYLEGWDRGWNFTGNIRNANYTHLSEGGYTLRIKSTNAEGIWSTNELRLTITVLPPWYRALWAYIVYLTAIVAVIYYYLRYRAKQTRLRYDVKIAKLNAETERAEKQKSVAEWQKEKAEREKGEAELAREKAEKERGQAELAMEKAGLEKERAERGREQAEREKERILNEKEREINEKKISFFTNISHEFRTPLTLIINPIKDLLKKKDEEQNKPDSELSIVYRNARRMLSLVDQLLLFRKAESGLDRVKASRLNLYNLAYEVYLCFIQQAKSKKINYIFACPNENLEIYADREKLEIILYNLISNALKYTPNDGSIIFTITEQSDNLLLEVKDSGAGIPKEIGEKLFEKFYKADRTITSSKLGFGIGLFLVKHFTELHKGTISYQSQEGHGATFTLTLLKGRDHFDPGSIVAEGASVPVILEELKEEEAFEAPENEQLKDVVTEKQTILIIDDDEEIRHYLVQLFKDNFITYAAENGEKGLKLAQKYLPNLIISDVHMLAMSGIELCKNIKESDSLNHIPVILLTASTSEELKLQGVEGGADDYITKPFDNKLLIARVSNLLKSRNKLQKYFYNEITLNKNDFKISPEYKEFLEKCISIVEKHLDDEKFSVKMLLAEMGMSHSNLFRKVKSVSGQSVNVFIRFIRLRKAAELLINSDYNVNETAFAVGIQDLKYFREQFNKLFGLNPSDYIKKYRKAYGKQYTVDKESIQPK